MVSQTNEQALESAIEKHLTGTCLEELKNTVSKKPVILDARWYQMGHASNFNAQYAINANHFWSFLKQTQKKELDKLKTNSPSDWQRKILERFDRMIKKYGLVHLLKKA